MRQFKIRKGDFLQWDMSTVYVVTHAKIVLGVKGNPTITTEESWPFWPLTGTQYRSDALESVVNLVSTF